MISSKPDFLGIGAQKAGTTWLWAQLKQRSDVWMPERKEIHYFDRHIPEPNYLAEKRLTARLFGREPQHRAWRQMMWADFRQSWGKRDLHSLRWQAQFYFGRIDDDWYHSLFPQDENLLCGEITPAYSILPEENVAQIARSLPNLKILLLLRNPIERAWSQVRFDWTRGARSEIAKVNEIKTFINSPAQELRSDYERTLRIWEAHIPPERFFIGFYDDVAERPAELLERVTRFLGLEMIPAAAQDLRRKVHVSREAEMPPEIRSYLCEKYEPALARLAQRFGTPVLGWLQQAREGMVQKIA